VQGLQNFFQESKFNPAEVSNEQNLIKSHYNIIPL